MRLRFALGALCLLGLAVPACSAEPENQSNDATEGALGFAPGITWGDSVSGQVASPQIDVWALSVKAGDKFRLTNAITGGDLRPDLVLFRGNSNNHISSDSHEANPALLTKDYTAEFNGRYYIVIRGYQNEGAGSYNLSAECLGGPCAGEVPPPPVVTLTDDEEAQCVTDARICAVDALPAYNGYVGTVRAKQVFDNCLSDQRADSYESDIPASCVTACAGENADICDGIVAMLPWLADQSAECIDEFNDCNDECYHASWGDSNGSVGEGAEAVCFTGLAAFNGSCGDVADIEVCGGEWGDDSCEACYIRCHATSGAWIDDLDTICDETCECEPSEDFDY